MEKLTLYHGSRQRLVGAIRPDRSDGTCDFGRGFYMGTEVRQPQTLICEPYCAVTERASRQIEVNVI